MLLFHVKIGAVKKVCSGENLSGSKPHVSPFFFASMHSKSLCKKYIYTKIDVRAVVAVFVFTLISLQTVLSEGLGLSGTGRRRIAHRG